jgi:SOS-response transcriptional repressor LexA
MQDTWPVRFSRGRENHIQRTDLRLVRERIRKLLAMRETSARAASIKAGKAAGSITDILTGKNTNPSYELLKDIAAALGSNLDYLVGNTDSPHGDTGVRVVSFPVVATVEAGVFREMPAEFYEAERPTIESIPHSRFRKARHFAVRVQGDSMDAFEPPIPSGAYALCVDIIDAELEVTTGEVYVIRRTLDAGQTYEWTIKEARVFADRVELHPRSKNPVHKSFTVSRRNMLDRDASNAIQVIGLVFGVQAKVGRT